MYCAFNLDILHEEGVRKRTVKFTSMVEKRSFDPGPKTGHPFPLTVLPIQPKKGMLQAR
jgi:hypothetical protein